MDLQTQLTSIDRFLSAIYGSGTSLEGLLGSLGFDPAQVKSLHDRHLPAIAAGLVEAVHARLTWEDKDTWFHLIARRFGLVGEPPAALEAAATALGLDPAYASRAGAEALDKCRTKTALEDFRKELRRLALAELSKSGEKPAKDHVVGKLQRLADLHAAVDVARIDYEAKRADVLKKVQAELDAIDLEFRPVLDAAEENATALEAEIKNDVLLRGESLRGGIYQAIYMKGRVSWDSRGIDDYARAHPEVLKFRKEGQPSVTLRAVSNPAIDKPG
jgi:hypothetical protein